MKRLLWFAFTLSMLCICAVGFAQETALDSGAVVTPPEWLVSMLDFIAAMPVVGPYVAIGLQWLAVLVTMVTAFTAFLLTSLKALQKVLSLTQLVGWVAAIQTFQDGKIMNWLKSISAFYNAKKKPEIK